MADFGSDVELEGFRTEAKAWLEKNFPKSLKGRAGLAMAPITEGTAGSDLKAWRDAIGAKGWATPSWPTEYGGGGLGKGEARILAQEMAKLGAFNRSYYFR